MMKLFMVLIGCKPKGRYTEQHDIFFGIAENLKDLQSEMQASWPEANGKIHLDAWREVTSVDGFSIAIEPREGNSYDSPVQLYFLNLGGYKPNEFEEFHYKMLTVSADKPAAIKQAKSTAFYKHTGFKGATSHIDDHYGIDVDDFYRVDDLLSKATRKKYRIVFTQTNQPDDQMNLGYVTMEKLATKF